MISRVESPIFACHGLSLDALVCLTALLANRPAFTLSGTLGLLCFAGLQIPKLTLVKLDDAAIGNDNSAAVLIMPSATHDPLKELSRVFDLAAKQVEGRQPCACALSSARGNLLT